MNMIQGSPKGPNAGSEHGSPKAPCQDFNLPTTSKSIVPGFKFKPRLPMQDEGMNKQEDSPDGDAQVSFGKDNQTAPSLEEMEEKLALMRQTPPSKKRPSACVLRRPCASVLRKPAAVLKKPAAVSAGKVRTKPPHMPQVHGPTKPKAVWYRRCRIYIDMKAMTFRVLTEPGNNYSEVRKGMGWKTQSVQQAWKNCLSTIEQVAP